MACASSAPPWQSAIPREVLQLRNIKRQMAREMSRMPNYTCLETIYRSTHESTRLVIAVPGKTVPFRRMDVVRLEVAEVNGNELFARPGEHEFHRKEITELVPGGLMGNGIFSGFAHDVFSSDIATFKFAGEERIDGRQLLRYDYRIPQLFSGYHVGSSVSSALVGYHGSFWADPQTMQAARMDVIADDIPPATHMAAVTNTVNFANVRIGASNALLPQSAQLYSRMIEGRESRNEVAFTHCREYGVESVISFGPPVDESSGKSADSTQTDVSPGLQLTISLETPIDSETAAVGDVIAGRVEEDVKRKNVVIVPGGAVLIGRLRRLDRHLEGFPYVLAELEFTRIEFAGKSARFFAVLEKILASSGTENLKRVPAHDLPGVGAISISGNRLILPAGMKMTWKTLSYEQAAAMKK